MRTWPMTITPIELSVAGIGIYHAGMTLDGRKVTESLLLNSTLRVVVCTSVRTTCTPPALALTVPNRHWLLV